MPLAYAVALRRDDAGAVVVTLPDFPGTSGLGEYEADALAAAPRLLASAVAACMSDRRPIPAPSPRPGYRLVAVPARLEIKIGLYQAMRAAGIGKAELTRRLRCHRPQVDRLLDVHHGSTLDQLEAGAAALGRRLTIRLDTPPLEARSSPVPPPRRRRRKRTRR